MVVRLGMGDRSDGPGGVWWRMTAVVILALAGCSSEGEQGGPPEPSADTGPGKTGAAKEADVATAWQDAVKQDDLLGYCTFLEAHPGQKTEEVKKRIEARLHEEIQCACTTDKPEVLRDQKSIPLVIFGNGARSTIAAGPITFGSAVFLSDPSDPATFCGTAKDTVYVGGRGCVILNGKRIYVYGISLPPQLAEK